MLFCRFLKATCVFPKWFCVFSCLSFFLLSSCVSVTEQPKPWADGVMVGKLDNGLTYYLYDSEKQTDPFNIRLIVNAGSVDETIPSGVAHMVEHMVFRSTKAHPESLHQYFNTLGWSTGKQVNAVTRESLTQFMIRTRVNDSLDLSQSLALLADIAFGAQFTEQGWQKEQNIILEEWRRGENVAKRVSRLKKEQVRHGSRYVGRPTIGTRESILSTKASDIAQFYKTFYVPTNMSIVISGNIDKQQAVKALNTYFGPQKYAPEPNRDYVQLPLKKQLHIGTIQDKDGSSSGTVFGFRSKLAKPTSLASREDKLVRYFLRKMLRNQVIRDREYYANRRLSLRLMEPTSERIIAAFVSRADGHQLALQDIFTERRRLLAHGLDDNELQALKKEAKALLLRQLKKGEDSRDYKGWEDRITGAIVGNTVLINSREKARFQLDLLDKITIERVNKRLRVLLGSEDQFVYLQFSGNTQKYLLSLAEVNAIKAGINASLEPTVFYIAPQEKPKTQVKPVQLPKLSHFAKGQIVSKKQIAAKEDAPSITIWQYANNDRIVWLNKKTPEDKLYLNITTPVGFENDKYSSTLSQIAVQLFEQTPAEGWSEEQWQKLPQWSWAYKANQLSLGAVIDQQQLPRLLEKYRLYIENGHIDETGFEQTKQNLVAYFNKDIKPATLKSILAQARFSEDDLKDPASDNIAKLNIATLEAVAKDVLHQSITLYVLGKQPKNTDTLLKEMLGSIERKAAIATKPKLQKKGTVQQEISFFSDPKSKVMIDGFTELKWTPERGFMIATLSEITRKQLKQRLRYQLSGIYNLDFSLKLDPYTNRAQLSLSFICAPERSDELLKAANDVLTSMPRTLKTLDLTVLKRNLNYAEKQRLSLSPTWLKRLELSFKSYDDARYLTHIRSLPSLVTNRSLASLAGKVLPVENQVTLVTKPIEVTE